MKNFSLKALGAIIFAAGLVVAGVAAPAAAVAGVTMVTSPTPTFDASTSSPAFTVAIDNGSSTFSSGGSGQAKIQIRGTMSTWSINSNCATTFTAYASANCGISSITGTGIGSVEVKKDVTELIISGLGSATSITIQFAPGAFQIAANGGSYNFNAETAVGTTRVLAITVNSPPPPQSHTVTFDANGGTGSMSNQTASGNVPLSMSTLTKAGTTFSGWSTTCHGRVEAMDQEPYTFDEDATLYAVWADRSNGCSSGGGGNAASASLSLNATTGQLIAGSTVGVSASGLQSTAAYTVTVQSTPQTIGTGNAVSGAVNTNVTLPSGLEAGWHTLTFTSTSSTGSAVESKYYFKISASGTLLSTSSTIPAELANTGINAGTGISLLAGGLSLALIGAEMFMIARRKRSN